VRFQSEIFGLPQFSLHRFLLIGAKPLHLKGKGQRNASECQKMAAKNPAIAGNGMQGQG
jgi:hypothetical protein